MKSGYQGEQDLFVVRLCLEVLIRNYKDEESALNQVPKVMEAFKHLPAVQTSPLVHFVTVLCEAIKLEGDDEVFKLIVGMYKPQLTRDKMTVEYVDRIAKYYFDTSIKQENPMQAMMRNMMNGKPPMMPPMMGGGGPPAAPK